MKKDILQKFILFNGEYVIGNRCVESMCEALNSRDTILLAPDVDREYWVDDIGKLPFDTVVKFANEEIKSIIHLGKSYQPFQYGVQRKDFIQLEKVTCKPMELIIRCYNDNVKDYNKVLKIMKELTPDKEEI
jgi:hypothetical protein